MLRMREMAFLCFKFQKCSGGVHPRPPPFMRGMLATHVTFSHCYPPLIYYFTARSLFKKCPPPHGKILKKGPVTFGLFSCIILLLATSFPGLFPFCHWEGGKRPWHRAVFCVFWLVNDKTLLCK
jgi:hypothetical protein